MYCGKLIGSIASFFDRHHKMCRKEISHLNLHKKIYGGTETTMPKGRAQACNKEAVVMFPSFPLKHCALNVVQSVCVCLAWLVECVDFITRVALNK